MAAAGFIQQGMGMYTQFAGAGSDAADQAGQQYASAETEESNAQSLDKRALQVGAEGARNEEQLRRGYRDFAGKQITSIAESGLTSDGSAMDVVRDSETLANLDALKMRYDSATKMEALHTDARAARFRSALARELALKHEKKRDGITKLWRTVHNPAGLAGRIAGKNPLDNVSSLNPK